MAKAKDVATAAAIVGLAAAGGYGIYKVLTSAGSVISGCGPGTSCYNTINPIAQAYGNCVEMMMNQMADYVKSNPNGFDQSEKDYIASASATCNGIYQELVQAGQKFYTGFNILELATEFIVSAIIVVITVKFGPKIANAIKARFKGQAYSGYSGGMYATDALLTAMFESGEIDGTVLSAYQATLSDLATNPTYGLLALDSNVLLNTYAAELNIISESQAESLASEQLSSFSQDIAFIGGL